MSMTNITSLDSHVNELIRTIKDAEKLGVNELIKSKVAFQLTKINFGLRLIDRIMKLYDLQEKIEDRLLTEDSIKDMSVRELLVMSSVNSKRLNDYFGKMDKILGSINLRELEGSLLLINEIDTKQQLTDQTNGGDTSLKTLSLQVLSQITKMGLGKTNPSDDVSDAEFEHVGRGPSEEDILDADKLVRDIDRVGEPSDRDIEHLLGSED